MKKIFLGKTDLQTAPIIFGGNVFGWTANEKTSFELLDCFLDLGFNMVDTANQYAYWVPGNKGGESETIIGNWLKKSGKRNEVIIATKVGGSLPGQPDPNTSKNYILKEVENSLRRLQLDCIDLYQTHFDSESVPVDETLEAYDILINAGKVRWIGASNLSAERLIESLKVSSEKKQPHYNTLQPEYNLYNREKYETQYEPIVKENGLGVITYYSLASGFLTGKYRREEDFNGARAANAHKMFNQRGIRILAALDALSIAYNTSQAAIALAWIIARPSISAPIVSATNIKQMQSMSEAVVLKLDSDAIEKLNIASA